MGVGDGLKLTQIRLGTARLTHCMRWLGMGRRALEIAMERVAKRDSFGQKLIERESVQGLIGQAAMELEIGRLLTMKAAWVLDQGGFARKEVSMAKVVVADALHKAVDTSLQLLGARAIRRTRRSSGCTATPARRGWWMARARCTGWCWRTSCAARGRTSSNGACPRMDEARLRDWLAAAAGDPGPADRGPVAAVGGAIQQNIALDVMLRGAPARWVLRTGQRCGARRQPHPPQEFALLRARMRRASPSRSRSSSARIRPSPAGPSSSWRASAARRPGTAW
jgi:hypothetical protein